MSAEETVIDGGVDWTETVSGLIKNVAKTMKDVPIVERMAELVFQIIQMRDVSPAHPFLFSAKAAKAGDEE